MYGWDTKTNARHIVFFTSRIKKHITTSEDSSTNGKRKEEKDNLVLTNETALKAEQRNSPKLNCRRNGKSYKVGDIM